jgi:hypothetical protein
MSGQAGCVTGAPLYSIQFGEDSLLTADAHLLHPSHGTPFSAGYAKDANLRKGASRNADFSLMLSAFTIRLLRQFGTGISDSGSLRVQRQI